MKEKFDSLSDEELISYIKNTKDNKDPAYEYLINKYKVFVKAKSRAYFLVGADHDDVLQEATIGFFKAIRDFDETKEVSFKAFADLCITRAIQSAIKTANRLKNIPLNNYVSLSEEYKGEENSNSIENILDISPVNNPEQMVISNEGCKDIEQEMLNNLSSFEHKVLSMYIDGYGYKEIAKKLKKTEKSIDNALQRIRNKLNKYLQEKR